MEVLFRSLFAALRAAGYAWEPATPERIQALRKQAGIETAYDPLVRFFGIGMPLLTEVARTELEAELSLSGFPDSLLEDLIRLRPSISRLDELFVPHMHWPAPAGVNGFVYLGHESFELARGLLARPESFAGRNMLDLGSGSGIFSLAAASGTPRVARALGLEISSPAVNWSEAAARAQDLPAAGFQCAKIGSREADDAVAGTEWSLAVSNPPLAVTTPGDLRPHRDGGRLGIELPLLFLDFAGRHLIPGGEVVLTATNPIIAGRSVFFDRAFGGEGARRWEIVEKTRLNDKFNASLHRKEGYAEQGIERIELWLLRLLKKA
jgi:SAM-dependent methyltransferase